jgi:hypothetical protein
MAITRIGVQPVIVSAPTAERTQTYRVGEVTDAGELASCEVTCSNDLGLTGNVNVVHWSGESGNYRIYKKGEDGAFGLIKATDGLLFIDDNVSPDASQSPPPPPPPEPLPEGVTPRPAVFQESKKPRRS